VLPFDYEEYAREISPYIDSARKKVQPEFPGQTLNFNELAHAAHHFEQAAAKMLVQQQGSPRDADRLNRSLRQAERALLIPEGLPNRPWFRHAIYAPGQYTGYAAVVIPGINEAIDKHDFPRAQEQIASLAAALNRAAKVLESDR